MFKKQHIDVSGIAFISDSKQLILCLLLNDLNRYNSFVEASSRAPVLPCRGVRSAVKCDRVSVANEEARLGYVQLQRTLGDVTEIVLG